MTKNLVIVESPAKAKTISKFLGKDFQVESSFGHIRDLPKSGMSVDTENSFEPKYVIPRDKTKVVNNLKKAAKSADMVWLASDEDREGEAIAWHLAQALGLKEEQTKRIVFHEITKEAITAAVENPRTVDVNLVNAQQARRILDRLVGYELSPVLWRKVQKGLSAGRVQSVAVRLIVEKEREIEAFEGASAYKVTAVVTVNGQEFTAELNKKLESTEAAEKFLEQLATAGLKVTSVTTKPASRKPSAPFTTSTLQQEASSKLGYSVKRTMTVAQKLYEAGHITYMRTDSVTLSDLAHNAIKSEVESKFGSQYYERRQYKTKSRGAQEAHEAIRPTRFDRSTAGDESQNRLYQLIWQRTVASQMAAAKLQRTVAEITIDGAAEKLIAKGEQITFDGFLKLVGSKSVSSQILPPLSEGDKAELQSAEAKQTFDKPPARFTEAALVKKLEELGIGRPSTYAPTISTIQDRNYVEKGDAEGEPREVTVVTLKAGKVTTEKISENTGSTKGKLMPTDMGRLVSDFLVKHFSSIVDYSFTAKVEEEFDDIADGKQQWQAMLKDFYGNFHPLVEKAQDIDASETGSRRTLGEHPTTGEPVYARFGRYGPMIQVGDGDKENKPKFLPMPKGHKIETVSLEEALKMEALPRTVGEIDGEEVIANIGPYGPYVKLKGKFISIGDKDPMTISLEEAKLVIAEQNQKNAPIGEWGSVKVLRGRYGPYVTDGKTNARIPKGVTPEEIDEKLANELIKNAKSKKKPKKK